MAGGRVDKLKLITHVAALTPLARLLWDFLNNDLTFNPIREIQLRTGKDALVLLILTLCCSPIKDYLGLPRVMRVRRILGLYAFSYAGLHFLTFVGLDYAFKLDLITEGVLKKPFALAGLAAFLILLPLAVTSTNGWARRLGKNWRRLHRLIYLAASLAIVHFFWLRAAKLNLGEPVIFGTVVVLLLVLRVPAVNKLLTSLMQTLRQPSS